MRLTACEMPIYRPGRGTNQALIEEFSESGNQCMMIEGWDESHQSMKSAPVSAHSGGETFRENAYQMYIIKWKLIPD